MLSANFSQPEIMPVSNRTENSDSVNLTCSSTQGYPAPKKMSFVLKTKNSTTEYDVFMTIFQNNITELYNVSISLSLPVSPETNVSIFCVLQLQSTQTQLLSQPFNIGKLLPKTIAFIRYFMQMVMAHYPMSSACQETSS